MPTSEQPRKRFRLLFLVVVALFVVAGVAMSVWLPYHREQQILIDIVAAGGFVNEREYVGPDWNWLRNRVEVHSSEQTDIFASRFLRMFLRVSALNFSDLHGDVAFVNDRLLEEIQKLEHLKELSISCEQITNASLQHLSAIPHLQILTLESNQITDDGLTCLREFVNLRGLGLKSTQITDAAFDQIANVESLEDIDLSFSTTITGNGLERLRSLRHLSSLELQLTDVIDDNLQQLRGIHSLQALDLSGTSITDAGLVYVSELSELSRLDLNGTEITDAGVDDLAKLSRLQILHIAGTEISAQGRKKLAERIPDCEIDPLYESDIRRVIPSASGRN